MKYRASCLILSSFLAIGGCATPAGNSNESDVLATLGHTSADKKLGKNENKSAHEYLAKGDDAFSAGDHDLAQVQYSLALNEDEKNTEALYKLAQIHYLTESYPVARSLLERVLLEEPESVGAFETLGLISLQSENYDGAERYFNQALNVQPDSWRSLNALGILRDVQGLHVEAQRLFQKALETVPTSAQVINNLGYSHYLHGNYPAAQQTFLKATRLDKNYAKAWSNLGLTFIRQKRYDEARAAFAKLVEPHVAANNLGYLSMLQGDLTAARAELDTAIRVAPQYYALANENKSLLEHQTNVDAIDKDLLARAEVSADNPSLVIVPASASVELNDPMASADLASKPKPEATVATKSNRASSNPPKQPAKSSVPTAVYLQFLGYGDLSAASSTQKALHDATLSFQINHTLDATGAVGPKTAKLLHTLVQRRVKATLNTRGYLNDSEVASTEDVRRATRSFEQDNGLKADGRIDAELLLTLSE